MATNYQQSDSGGDSSEYLELLGFLQTTWFKALVIVEIIMFGGGYVVSLFGQETEAALAGQHPDVHMSLAGIMGALGILFGAFLLITVGISVYLRMQKLLEPDVEF